MGTWGTAIKDSDTFADIYGEFFDLYNKGGQPDAISEKILDNNREILEDEEGKHCFWFALAMAQWETKSLDQKVLSIVETIVNSNADLKIWLALEASEQDIKKRRVALEKFLEKIKSDRPKAKPRKRIKLRTPIFTTGECLTFKLSNGNYGGAVVLATDKNPETGYNLVATTRLNLKNKPTCSDFENSEALICNFGNWQDEPVIVWYMPDLYYKDYSKFYEVICKIDVQFEYDINNIDGKGYSFHPSFAACWTMNAMTEMQLESETLKAKPAKTLTIKQLTKKDKWWKLS
jgi:hypothetical protein